MKREASPKFWPIQRKKFSWAVKPNPGSHPINRCMPLALIVREMFGFAKTRREAKKIISQGSIMIDGKILRDDLFPAGLMDVISIHEIKKDYRVLPSKKGLILHPISKDEAEFKLCRIENKSLLKNGNIQLNLHDGRNLLIRVRDSQKPEEDIYRAFDTLKISLNSREILEHIKMAEGMSAIFIGGDNIGKYGHITSIEKQPSQKRKDTLVTIKDGEGETYQTILNYVFVVGNEEPRISLPQMEGR